jgi:type II secretory pathway pseudopilin PulG
VSGLERPSPFRVVARVGLPNVFKAAQTALKNQTQVNQLVIASALELYRKEQGEYPATLEELSPKFLKAVPKDLILGQPLRYERRRNGEYALYSIAWNGKDDIAPLLANAETPMFDIFESKTAADEWVWKGVPEPKAK